MSDIAHQTSGLSSRAPMVAVLGATLAAVAIWAVVTAAGVDLTVSYPSSPPTKITVINVVVASLLGSLLGWGLLALLRRFTANALSIWTVISIVAALLSLAGPLTTIAPMSTKLSLVAMHLAVASVTIVVLRRATPA